MFGKSNVFERSLLCLLRLLCKKKKKTVYYLNIFKNYKIISSCFL